MQIAVKLGAGAPTKRLGALPLLFSMLLVSMCNAVWGQNFASSYEWWAFKTPRGCEMKVIPDGVMPPSKNRRLLYMTDHACVDGKLSGLVLYAYSSETQNDLLLREVVIAEFENGVPVNWEIQLYSENMAHGRRRNYDRIGIDSVVFRQSNQLRTLNEIKVQVAQLLNDVAKKSRDPKRLAATPAIKKFIDQFLEVWDSNPAAFVDRMTRLAPNTEPGLIDLATLAGNRNNNSSPSPATKQADDPKVFGRSARGG